MFNVGELIGELVAPVLRQTFGFELAFIFCTCFAFAALVALASGANSFVHKHNASHSQNNRKKNNTVDRSNNDNDTNNTKQHNRDKVVVDDDYDDDDEEKPSLLRSLRHDWLDIRNVVALYVAMPMYWALYVQHNSTWVYQGQRMDLRITHVIIICFKGGGQHV